MSTNFVQFITHMMNFIETLNRYRPNPVLDGLLNMKLEEINFNNIIARYLGKVNMIKDKLNNNDYTIFDSPLKIIPDYDISEEWGYFTSGQKKKVITYMKLVYVQAELVVGLNNTEDEFNPFDGLDAEATGFDLDKMEQGIDNLIDVPSQSTPGLDGLIEMSGLSKHLNVDSIIATLKNNMTDDEFDKATNTVCQIFNGGEQMNKSIGEIMKIAKTEIMENTKDSGNKIGDILKLSENMAGKIKDKINIKDININEVLNNLKTMNVPENGEQVDPAINEKLAGLVNMMGSMMNGKNKGTMNSMLSSMGINPAQMNNPHSKKYVPKKKNKKN